MQKLISLLLLTLILSMTGCSQFRFPGVFKIDIGQGNIVSDEAVSQLREGMTKRQVRFLLGSPLLQDMFHPNRWDYYYSLKPGKKRTQSKRLTIFFEQGKLNRIEGDYTLSEQTEHPSREANSRVQQPESAQQAG